MDQWDRIINAASDDERGRARVERANEIANRYSENFERSQAFYRMVARGLDPTDLPVRRDIYTGQQRAAAAARRAQGGGR